MATRRISLARGMRTPLSAGPYGRAVPLRSTTGMTNAGTLVPCVQSYGSTPQIASLAKAAGASAGGQRCGIATTRLKSSSTVIVAPAPTMTVDSRSSMTAGPSNVAPAPSR